jgi:hypothetical protein
MVEDDVRCWNKVDYDHTVIVDYMEMPNGHWVGYVREHDEAFNAKSLTECAVLVAKFLNI